MSMKPARDSAHDACAFHTTLALLESAIRLFEQLSVDGAHEYQQFAERQADVCRRKQLRVIDKYHRALDRIEALAKRGEKHAD